MNKVFKVIISTALLFCVLISTSTIQSNATNNYQNTAMNLIVNTDKGRIEGFKLNDDLLAWYGVPYAKPPVDNRRWKAPESMNSWSYVKKTQKKRKAANVKRDKYKGKEDCLYLNITRPNDNQKKLPVVIYLHGGGNTGGSGSKLKENIFIEKTDCILISIEYRLGAFGWFKTPYLMADNKADQSGNFALLDIIKALKWINKNIDNFGGDKNNITLFGSSAGARNAYAVMFSPLSKGLFHKAILLAGGPTTSAPKKAEEIAEKKIIKILKDKNIVDTKAEGKKWLEKTNPKKIKRILYNLSPKRVASIFSHGALSAEKFPNIISDGYVLPGDINEAIKKGNYSDIPIIIGSNADEFSKYVVNDRTFFRKDWKRNNFKKDKEKGTQAQLCNNYGSKLYSSFNLEMMALLLSENGNHHVYAHQMQWGRDENVTGSKLYSTYIGATHNMFTSFLNYKWKGKKYKKFAPKLYSNGNLTGRKSLSDAIYKYYRNFIHKGTPNGNTKVKWTAWSNKENDNKILTLDATKKKAKIHMTSKYINAEEIYTKLFEDENLNISEATFYKLFCNRPFIDGNIFIKNSIFFNNKISSTNTLEDLSNSLSLSRFV